MRTVSEGTRIWTVGQLATRLRMHRNSIRMQIEKGLIPATRTPGGHYRIDDTVVQVLLTGLIPQRAA